MNLDDDAARVVDRYWQLMNGNDFATVGSVLTDAFVCEWPQSNELIRGRDAFAGVNAEYPTQGRWRFEVQRLVADGDVVATDTVVSNDAVTARVVSFFAVRAGEIDHLREYWPDDYQAPLGRAHLVEPLTRAVASAAPPPQFRVES
ncbi:nuclear transport factor 2 family protein [Demequina sp. TTPB684]|uniref:nuclear transport factor 2 family protein n=1 Tax=unclassified Demequina TaxID=2620311 RepID=UPI001CF58CEE|nr:MULTISPECIES: nuclear transport factor 2 family protein [unclassified Demequina]MCB2413635.1 nuclear transport factor 2 family protein [Demequina sp. TTPB684]UPU88242.1 nuclear transport factor 2 family protein [Demequina sp. TMPB413]